MEVELGSKVKDDITGFIGIATARCMYINGCVQFEITPLTLKDGVPQEEYWLDSKRLVLVCPAPKKHQCDAEQEGPWGPGGHPKKKHPPSLAGYEKEK